MPLLLGVDGRLFIRHSAFDIQHSGRRLTDLLVEVRRAYVPSGGALQQAAGTAPGMSMRGRWR